MNVMLVNKETNWQRVNIRSTWRLSCNMMREEKAVESENATKLMALFWK